MDWKNINVETPKDGERVLVWDERFGEVRILTYNDYYKCWDGEDGDDCECALDDSRILFWMPLPSRPY